MELMPERCGTGQSRDFEAILEQVITGWPSKESRFLELFAILTHRLPSYFYHELRSDQGIVFL